MPTRPSPDCRIAVVIPCYRVKAFILDVIAGIPAMVEKIWLVDDACPERSGAYVQAHCPDPRVEVLFNPVNLGVGGAVVQGYKKATEEGFSIVVKIDGDGQMDGRLIPQFVAPIQNKEADYTKGNRFYYLESLSGMPKLRLFGNALLSFVTKLSSGYWNLFDPTNGFTAISVPVLRHIALEKVSKRYFFESDMLFRLNLTRAVVWDIPMDAHYGKEASSLRVSRIILPFLRGHVTNFCKRIFYNYYLRNFSLASLELLFGLLLTGFGTTYGIMHWTQSIAEQQVASAGTVMVAALPFIVGFQMLMAFLSYDITMVPNRPLTRLLRTHQ